MKLCFLLEDEVKDAALELQQIAAALDFVDDVKIVQGKDLDKYHARFSFVLLVKFTNGAERKVPVTDGVARHLKDTDYYTGGAWANAMQGWAKRNQPGTVKGLIKSMFTLARSEFGELCVSKEAGLGEPGYGSFVNGGVIYKDVNAKRCKQWSVRFSVEGPNGIKMRLNRNPNIEVAESGKPGIYVRNHYQHKVVATAQDAVALIKDMLK